MEKLGDSLQKLNHLHSLYIQHGSFASWNNAEQEIVKSNLTYHSNKIEGLTLSYGETIRFLKDNLVKPGVKIKDLYDLKNHQEVLGKIFTTYDQMKLSEQTIRELHAELMKDDAQWEVQDAELAPAGYYKINDNFTYRPGGYHMYLPHAEVPKAMAALISQTAFQLNNSSVNKEGENNHPLIIIARFHFQFLQIHPFADGNGRMARLLTALLLLQYKFPPVIIEEQERVDYFQRLISSEEAPDQFPIISFFVDKCIFSLTQKLSTYGH